MARMDIKLFISTFFLIFLAELGDKTQLAAFARSASGGASGKWTVFFAASGALVLSTLLAVLLGAGIQRVGLPERQIRAVAGALFIVLGIMLVYRAVRPETEKVEPAALRPGVLTNLAFQVAADFEEAAARHYRRLAGRTEDYRLRELLLSLAEEEQYHAQRVKRADLKHEGRVAATPEAPPPLIRPEYQAGENELLEEALQHELATVAFYEELARVCHIRTLKPVFTQLADDERRHAEKLRESIHSA